MRAVKLLDALFDAFNACLVLVIANKSFFISSSEYHCEYIVLIACNTSKLLYQSNV